MTDVVVCAHNEEATIAGVLSAIRGADGLGRIIVVADTCTDGTEAIARVLADEVVVAAVRDKGSAMAAGLRQVRSPQVLFCDADLVGLRAEHIAALLGFAPAQAMVVGLRDGYPRAFGRLPSISGERRVPTALAAEVRLEGAGWQAETRINAAAIAAGLPWYHLLLAGVSNPRRPKPLEWRQVAEATLSHGTHLLRYVARGRKAP